MNCKEQLKDEDYTYLFRDCVKPLGHPGAHEDARGHRYPRPTPTGDAWEALDFINGAADASPQPTWGLDERDFTIVFEVTNVYAVKVTAENEDDALRQYDDMADLPDFKSHEVINGDVDVRRLDYLERSDLHSPTFGPEIACPDCGRTAMRRSWYHTPYRKCHGPIEWRETDTARDLRWRFRRDFKATPVVAEAVAA